MPSMKDVSETIRNLATAAGIVIGGGWVLYEWDTFFPKTDADVAAAAATVGTNVVGAFEVVADTAPDGISALDECLSGNTDLAVLELPVVAHARLSNTGKVPVWVEASMLQIRRHDTGTARFRAGTHDVAFADPKSEGLWRSLDFQASIGERAILVAPGEADSLFLAVSAHFPFDCALVEEDPSVSPVFSFQFGLSAEAVDPRTGERISESNVGLSLTKPCRISTNGNADCEIFQNADGS